MATTTTSTTAPSNLTGLEDIVKATSHTATVTNSKSMGKDEFLKMLLAQLKNQDPLSPMNGTDFAAQMAQFSSLEQLTNLNTELQNQTLSMTTMAHTQAVSMIGKDVTISNSNGLKAEGQPKEISYNLAKDAQYVEVYITDKDGNTVKTIGATEQKAGQNSVTWDMSANTTGDYTFQVVAKDSLGNAVTATPLGSGTVEAVKFKNNEIYVVVNGKETSFSDVTAVS